VDFLGAEKETLRCDAVIIADSSNWRIGEPAITTTLRATHSSPSRCASVTMPCTAANSVAWYRTRSWS